MSTPTFATGSGPQKVVVSRSGSYLYVTNAVGNTVSAFAIGSAGLLKPLSAPSFATGANPQGIALVP